MKSPSPDSTLFSALILLSRIALGLFFLLAGVGKIIGGVGEFVQGPFAGLQPGWLPDVIAMPYGYALPFVETTVGALLVLGLFGRVAAGVCALLLISFLLVIGITHKALPFQPNVIFLSLALLLTGVGPWRLSVDAILYRKRRRRSH